MASKKRRKKNGKDEPVYNYHIEQKLIHGQLVDVKVYEPQAVPDDTHITGPGAGQWWQTDN